MTEKHPSMQENGEKTSVTASRLALVRNGPNGQSRDTLLCDCTMLLPWRWVALLALLPLVLAKSCPAGQAASALSPCTACRKGFFKPAAGDAPCQACPAGTYQDGRNATRCTDCPPGQFTATEGRALCDFCPRSSFAASPGSTSCELCPERSTSATLGSVTIADCRVRPAPFLALFFAATECTGRSAVVLSRRAAARCPRRATRRRSPPAMFVC